MFQCKEKRTIKQSQEARQEARRASILQAALLAFARYGFKRTSMADIAELSGVPRTALYRLFKSKEAIFTALVRQTHQEALALAKAELAQDGPLTERVERSLLARDGHLLEVGHSGPHAAEVAELYSALAGDITQDNHKKLEQLLANAINAAVRAEQYDLPTVFSSGASCARILRMSLEGVKQEIATPDEFQKIASQCIRALLR